MPPLEGGVAAVQHLGFCFLNLLFYVLVSLFEMGDSLLMIQVLVLLAGRVHQILI